MNRLAGREAAVANRIGRGGLGELKGRGPEDDEDAGELGRVSSKDELRPEGSAAGDESGAACGVGWAAGDESGAAGGVG